MLFQALRDPLGRRPSALWLDLQAEAHILPTHKQFLRNEATTASLLLRV